MVKYKKKRSMKIGGKHVWNYKSETWKETKVSPKKWLFTYSQIKRRKGRSAPKGSGFPVKGKLHWKIFADQYAIKTGPNTYKLVMKGKKYRKGWKKPRDKKWRK